MATETVAGFDFHPVELDRDARIVRPEQSASLLGAVGRGTGQLLVLSHGWNNDMSEARRLYVALLESIAAVERGRLAGTRTAVLGVFWPSKRFAERDLVPGGVARVDGDLPLAVLEEQILGLRDVLGPDVASALLADAAQLDTTRAARRRFGEAVQQQLAKERAADEEAAEELSGALTSMPGEQMFDEVQGGDPVGGTGGDELGGVVPVGGDAGWAAAPDGGAAGLGSVVRGVRDAASQLLNLTTYWAMKRRAGSIGRDGLNPLLRRVREVRPGVRLHLAGHSFGGRLVTAAVLGGEGTGLVVDSLVLLQPAFSHHGFADRYDGERDGLFRPVVTGGRVRGPIVVTHTPRDLANRWAYPAASRLAGHTGAGLPGGAESLYGALGANGAQRTPEAVDGELRAATAPYDLAPGLVHNLAGGDHITGHSDVAGRQVANALVAAIAGGVAPADRFDPGTLDRSTIALPQFERMARLPRGTRMHVTIDLHLRHPGGLEAARRRVTAMLLGSSAVTEDPLSTGGGPGTGPGPAREPSGAPAGARSGRDGAPAPRTPSATVAAHLTAVLGDEATRWRAATGDGWLPVDPLVDWPGLVPAPPDGPAPQEVVDVEKGRLTPQYVHAFLTEAELRSLVELDGSLTAVGPSIYKVWPDFDVAAHTTRSVRTVKADAARAAFSAAGEGIVWAVADTGIDGAHEHFARHRNLQLGDLDPIAHQDFVEGRYDVVDPVDPDGHGTHVAGIIAGESPPADQVAGDGAQVGPASWMATSERDTAGDVHHRRVAVTEPVAGMAPRTRLVSLRVLDEHGKGRVSNLLAAIGYVQRINDHGRWIRIHGLNLSVGYGFDPEWFACGQSPLCVEVDRLVRSGVSVVVAAGNTGYLRRGGPESAANAGLDLTINDPGNADLAITVGATHRDEPHVYGVSYFSSKGPTGDGRLKPDLVAPGERILSCAAGRTRATAEGRVGGGPVQYRTESGTSMAAPHVSGAVAAFLSIRPEFRGRPQRVKEVFLDSATDLRRERYFQGHGLVDLMRAIQSV